MGQCIAEFIGSVYQHTEWTDIWKFKKNQCDGWVEAGDAYADLCKEGKVKGVKK